MVKKSLEKGVWAPHTPKKSVPPTTRPVSTDRRWRSHVGGSFSHAISQDSTAFNALTDCIDAAESLKEAIGNALLPAVSTPSENDNTRGSHKDYVDSKKQTRKKPKRKKYWPKVLVEVKPKENPKPKKNPKPSTPKPCTPKPSKRATSKRCSDEKRKDVGEDCLPSASSKPSKHARVDGQEIDATYVPESAKRALSFNLQNHETDSKKDARIIIHQYQRRKKDIGKTSCDAKALEQSKEGNLMVQNLSGMTSSFNPSEEWIRPTQLSETEREAANDPRSVNQSGCCNQNFLIVYQRVFRANQCLRSSRKLGPNFPRMWKKTRMTRRKATTYVIFKSLIAAEDRQMPRKKGTIRKQKATNFGRRRSAESAKQAEKWVKPSNFPSVMTKALEQSKEGNLMVQNLSGMTYSFNPSEEWIRPNQLSETEREAANNPHNVNQSGFCKQNSLIVYQRVFRANQCLSSSRKLGPNFPRMWKKTRTTRRKATTTYVIFKSLIAAEDRQMPLKKGMIRKQKATNFGYRRSAESAKQAEKWVKPCNFPSVMTKRQLALAEKKGRKLALANEKRRQLALANKKRRQSALQKDEANRGGLVPHYSGLMISPTESQNWSAANDPNSFQCALSLTPQATPRKKRSYKPIPKLNLGSLALTLTINRFPSAPLPQSLNVRVLNQDLLVTGYENMVAKRQHMMGFLDNAVLGHNEVQGCPEHVLSSSESLQDLFSVQLTNGVERLESLHISDAGSQLVVQNQNAHGKVDQQKAVIVYKKRKPPPKVDIDQETMRVWKLLMANSGEDVEEENDEDKEKWWEEQRNICRGRVDSFIARMHLVQGDRRFSRWKGSVVDSVVGVFLTQNVSDHLSSSAFMSLAAKYPLRSATEHKTCDEDGGIAYSQESVASNKRERIQDEVLQQDFLDSLIDDPPSTNKHSIIESFRGFSEIVQTEYTTCLREFSTNENGDLLGNESLLDEVESISEEEENAKQGSSLNLSNPLFGVNDTPSSICSLTSQKHYACIPLTPSHVGVESRDSGNNTMNDVGDISDNLGCMESFGRDAVVQKKPTPRAQEATVELCSSFSKCHVLPECLSQEEVNKAKGQELGKNYREDSKISPQTKSPLRKKKSIVEEKQEKPIDWDDLRKNYVDCTESTSDAMDSLGWEEVRQAAIDDVADAIKGRGQHRVLAERIKDFLDRVVRDHGSINLEWLRSVPPDKAKEYLLSFKGLGLKSVECVRLLTLQHHAFPVDTNVGRVAVRLGWVPLKPLPESLQIHLLEQYPVLDTIQIYLWPRLCTLDQRTLYELHYQMITFGKVFCRKRKPNCNACPMRGECRHFASAFASTRLALPGPQAATSIVPYEAVQDSSLVITPANKSLPAATFSESRYETKNCEPIIEHPPSPEPEPESIEYLERDIEDLFDDPEDYIPAIRLDVEEFKERIQEFIDMSNIPLEGVDMSKALVALTSEAASIPLPKLKDISWLRTIHHVYELPDSHRILAGFDKREPDDPSPYLLAIWTSGGTAISSNPPRKLCDSSQESHLSNGDTCSSCNNAQDQNVQTVRGTILIPCRTATRGSFPLNGTYFQVNEVFADDETSQHPLTVPRAWIWSLRRRTLHCGAYLGAIFGGLSTAEIQRCFWTGFVCVRAFNRTTRAPAHLSERFHVSPILRGKKKFTEDE